MRHTQEGQAQQQLTSWSPGSLEDHGSEQDI